MERTAAHTVAAAALAVILTSCGTVGSSETSTADPTIEPESTSGVNGPGRSPPQTTSGRGG